MKVAVIGVGYVGAVSAAGLAAAGHEVTIFDVDQQRALALLAGGSSLHEPGLAELVAKAGGRLRVAATLASALAEARCVLVCVQTPARADGAIDLSFVERAFFDIAAAAGEGSLTVTIRSTVVPGTTERLDREILAPARERGIDIEAAANPEFLREGRAVADFVRPDRIVIGASSDASRAALAELYASTGAPVHQLDPSSAELAKYASNALLATLVSFTNELADIAESIPGVDVVDVLRVLHADRRWREADGDWSPGLTQYLWPGCGYGGSCLPKDVKALLSEARRRGVETPMLESTDRINERRAAQLADRIQEVTRLDRTRVAVLGTAFKEGTADARSSPGIAIADELQRRGAVVKRFDPLLPGTGGAGDGLDETLRDARIWVVVTGAREFADLPSRARSADALLVDARRRYPTIHAIEGYVGPGYRAAGKARRGVG